MDQEESSLLAVSRKTKVISDTVMNVTRICLISSASLGTLLLLLYLDRVGAPFPPIDSSLGLLSNIFILLFALMMGTIFTTTHMPVVLKFFVDNKTRVLYPAFFEGRASLGWDRKTFFQFYAAIYFPIYAIVFLLMCWFIIDLPSFSEHPTSRFLRDYSGAWLFIFCYAAAVGISCATCRLINLTYGYKRFPVKDIFMLSCFGSIPTILWSSYFLRIIFYFLQPAESFNISSDQIIIDFLSIGALLIIITLLSIFHYTYSTGSPKKSTSMAWLFVCVVFTLMIYPQGSVLTANMLRILGMGGGLPVSIEVKSYGSSSTSPTRTIRGCLIFGTGSTIIIRPFNDKEWSTLSGGNSPNDITKFASASCSIQPVPAMSSTTSPSKMTGIEIYNRTDVIRIGSIASN